MPEQLTVEGIVLRRRPVGEKFLHLDLLTASHGLMGLRKPISASGKSGANPDWLDLLQCTVQRNGPGSIWYGKEWLILHRHTALAQSSEAMQCAATFSRFLLVNLPHFPTDPEPHQLLRDTLQAWEERPHPTVALLKAYYRFARTEGFPVREHWLISLPPESARAAEVLLRTPLDQLPQHNPAVTPILHSLQQWMQSEAELRFPN